MHYRFGVVGAIVSGGPEHAKAFKRRQQFDDDIRSKPQLHGAVGSFDPNHGVVCVPSVRSCVSNATNDN